MRTLLCIALASGFVGLHIWCYTLMLGQIALRKGQAALRERLDQIDHAK